MNSVCFKIFVVTLASLVAAGNALILVPNQDHIWVNGHHWAAPFNKTMRGSGGLNKFGQDLENAGWQWTSQLCQADSDGDGFTNGAELGDPDCTWTHASPSSSSPVGEGLASHPGFSSSVPDEGFTTNIKVGPSCPTGTPVQDVAVLGNAERIQSRSAKSGITLPDGLVHGTRFWEVAEMLKPEADTFTPEQRSTCPHLQQDVKLWHDSSIWPGGSLPTVGSNVTLPENTKIVVTACSFPNGGFAKMTIPSTAELIFADDVIHLVVKDIVVLGKLILGSESCPLHSPITITFVATKAEMPWYSNGIMVISTGQMLAYGTRSDVTWTRLSATAKRGSKFLTLQDPVDWGVGEEIFVTTSIFKDLEENQNEVRRVAAVSHDGRVIVLDKSLNHSHYGGHEYQCEVGLLSRSILFRGWKNGYDDRYGGHTMAVGPGVVYKLVGVKAQRMGQRNVVARYPFHQHLLQGGGSTSTFQQLTCQDCYYRCAVIHQTNHSVIRKSVAFNVTGHTYYLEEGVEMNNTIEFNLAAYIHPIGTPASGGAQGGERFDEEPECTQPADHTASGFYIPNPSNIIVGNAASGGWSGFSFPIFEKPIRLSKDWPMEPYRYVMGRFDGNSAHSSGYFWGDAGCVYTGGKLWEEESIGNKLRYSNGRHEQRTVWWPHGDNRHAWHNITNLRTWLCQKGYSSWGDRVDITKFECHDCERSAVLFGSSSITNALIVGTSNNNPKDMETVGRQGFGFYDTWVKTVIANITFRNYHMRRSESKWGRHGVIVDLTHSDIFKPWGISATKNLRFENVDQSMLLRRWVRETGASRMFNVVDWDGSVVGSSGCDQYIIGSEIEWWDVGEGCFHRSDWQSYVCPRIPGREPVGLDMELPGQQEEIDVRTESDDTLTPENREKLYIGHISQFGANAHKKLIITKNKHLATGHSGIGWYMYLKDGMPTSVTITAINFPRGTYIVLAMSYPAGSTFTIYAENRWGTKRRVDYQPVNSAQEVANRNGTFYHFDGAHLFVKVLDFWIDYPNAYIRGGATITSANQDGRIYIDASCPTKNGDFCAPPSGGPNPPAELSLPITPCTSEADITAAVPPLAECASETQVLPTTYASENPGATCYDFRKEWSCNGKSEPDDCLAYCKKGCHQNLRPYTCSYDAPCDTTNKPIVAKPWCEWQNENPRSDPCYFSTCNYTTNATIRVPLPHRTPCRLGDGQDGICLSSGVCQQNDEQLDTRGIEHLTASDLNGEHIDFYGPKAASTSDVTVSVQFADGTSASGAPSIIENAGASWFYRFTVGKHRMPFVMNVSVTVGSVSRVFGDWHETVHLAPSVKLSCRNATHWFVAVSPQNWIGSAAYLEDEANTTQTLTVGRTTTGFWFDTSALPAGELRLRLPLHWGGEIVRTFPCHKQSSDDTCHSPATTIRSEPSPCKYIVADAKGNSYWFTLQAFPATGVDMIWAEGAGNLSKYSNARFGGSPNGKIIKRVVKLILTNGDVEFFEATTDMMGTYNALTCLNGTAPTSIPLQQGPAGTCGAENICSVVGFAEASGTAPELCPSDGTVPSPPPPPPPPSETTPSVISPTSTQQQTVQPDSPTDTAAVTSTADPGTPTTVAATSSVTGSPNATQSPPNSDAPDSTAITTGDGTVVATASTGDPSPTATTPEDTQAPVVTTPTPPPPPVVVVVTAQIRLNGNGFQSLLSQRREELETAVLNDLKRLLRLSEHQTIVIVKFTIGSLVVDFTVTHSTKTEVDASLATIKTNDDAQQSSSSSTTWVQTDALHKESEPTASAIGVTSFTVTDSTSQTPQTPNPAGPTTNGQDAPSGCGRGCQVIAVVAAVCVIVVVAAIVLIGTKKNNNSKKIVAAKNGPDVYEMEAPPTKGYNHSGLNETGRGGQQYGAGDDVCTTPYPPAPAAPCPPTERHDRQKRV